MIETAGATRPCSRCEALPERTNEAGRLHLWFPIVHAKAKCLSVLRRKGHRWSAVAGDAICVEIDEGGPSSVAAELCAVLSASESADTRALFKSDDAPLGAIDFGNIRSLAQVAAIGESEWLLDVLDQNRLVAWFQPIVHVAEPDRIFAHEALLRGLDAAGQWIQPGRLFTSAHATGLLFQLDLAARRAAIASAIRRQLSHNIFINFTPTSIYDPATCLRTTVDAIDRAGIAHERIVFEIVESERAIDITHLCRIIEQYRANNFRVALDDVGSGYSSLNLIHQLRPDFIKLDMELVRGVHKDPYKAVIASKILEISAGLGIETIVEGVEEVGELHWARERGATYAQGFLIARPSLD